MAIVAYLQRSYTLPQIWLFWLTYPLFVIRLTIYKMKVRYGADPFALPDPTIIYPTSDSLVTDSDRCAD